MPPEVFLVASYLSAPPAVNLLVFPLAFFLHPILGSATLLSINFSEWLNCALKWSVSFTLPHFLGGLIGQAFYQWVMRYTLECTSTSAASIDLRPSALTSPQRLTIIGTLSFVLGEAIGATLNFLGVDVDRSFRMARTYCDRREWVHSSTSVEASYARITGALLGLAGALIFRPLTVRNLKPPPVTVRRVIFPCIMCIIACYYCQRCISFIAPLFKCILGYIPLGSEASFLFYMGILGASCPLFVALAFSSLLDKLAYCKACQYTTSKHNTTPASHGHDSEASARSGRPRSRSRR
ncbi:unnamed protein product [Taenia asiatica]|uniref:Uncharacterized protein n=1 Tax=Taenia asiatica TaxID=60517 RepID=A0A3P6QMK4_TAEAS|nr:unnamed protein product [Taenia asiatica]